MDVERLHDRAAIERCLRRNTYLHIYALGDLDEFFWPYTTWYGGSIDGHVQEVVLLYAGSSVPTLLALTDRPGMMAELLRSIGPTLPERFYAHLTPGLEHIVGELYDLNFHGPHLKMALLNDQPALSVDGEGVEMLGDEDLAAILQFYRESYPGNWFDARMLKTRQYFGLRDRLRVVSIAGIHVYSPTYRVAALGNIATSPSYRNRGLGRKVTARLCRSLLGQVDHIGLNVKADNRAAISCYERLGFEVVASYGEFTATRS